MIKSFVASNFKGTCLIDEDFEPYLIKTNEIAIKRNMLVIVTSSGRIDLNVKGAIVMPAKKGNHLVFQAIDFNLKNLNTGEYYNSTKLGDGTGEDEKFCLEVVRETGLYWGVAFNNPDSVHMDSRLNVNNPNLWQKKYNEIHNVIV